ncbi:MAG: caspase family protein, partial [Desulfobulbaceae bacterium]|nr:caspase family protein [Desulfobulbaceae bacterium]
IEKAIRLNPYNSTYKNLHADIKAAIKKQPSILVAKPAPPKKEKPVSVLAAKPVSVLAAKPAPPARKALPPNLGAYHALIIGNNNYQHLPKLKTAENDARAMASLLKSKYQFSVKLTLNATRANILKALTKYRRLMTDKDNLLIYYAGHGWLDNDADQGYWLPVDAANDDPTNWLSNASITSALRAIRAKHVMVVADSCYSGKLARGVHIRLKSSDYYTKILSKKARTVMASGGLEPVTDDGGKGKHSIFASALIEALNDNKDIIDATTLFSQIRRPVMLNSDQTPEYSDIRKAGHDGGDFVFVSRK